MTVFAMGTREGRWGGGGGDGGGGRGGGLRERICWGLIEGRFGVSTYVI